MQAVMSTTEKTALARLLSHTPFRRTLAPGGGFPSPSDVFSAPDDFKQTILGDRGGAPVLAKSGTEALRLVLGTVLRTAARPYVAISAYTCPDLYTAVHAAGFQAVLFDIDPKTLLPRPESLPELLREQIAAVILSNLYGLIDPTEGWNISPDVVLIDDGCQAALGSVGATMVGSRGVGVISFGRGKAFSGVGGGAALGVAARAAANATFGVGDLIRGAVMWALEKPYLYGIPTALPFLGLGETAVHLELPSGTPSTIQRRYANFQLAHRNQTAAIHRERMGWWREALAALAARGRVVLPEVARGERPDESAVLLRYPILVDPRDRAALLPRIGRYGVSRSYPTTLDSYAEIGSSVKHGDISGAVTVAQQLLTLPLHRYVTPADVARVVEEMERL